MLESVDAKLLAAARDRAPVPIFWLFGKTQSGKTSVIRYLTGAADAEIGEGFRPCTRFSREYQFPSAEAPLIRFLDTRGLDEPGYDPAEDVAAFHDTAHLVLVTVKATDHALENLERHLRAIRRSKPSRPVVLAVTCLHEAYPMRQHPPADEQPPELARLLDAHRQRFDGLFDEFVAIDLTRPDDGFDEPNLGGDELKRVLLERLPHAYSQTLRALDASTRELTDADAKRTQPIILSYTAVAAAAGAVPVPWVDLLILPGIQTKMVHHLARTAGRPLEARHFLELASTLGIGMMARQAIRELVKLIPFGGSVAGAALAAASTYALGRAFCLYYRQILAGHVPDPAELKRYYAEQLRAAEQFWRSR